MNVIKKLIAAASAAVSVSAFAVTSAAVYAEETTTTTDVTTTSTSEQSDITTETTTNTTDTSDTSDTTTTTTSPIKHTAWLSFNKGGNSQTENAVEFSTNGTYTVKYKFSAADAAAAIDSIILESDVTTDAAADFKFKVTSIKVGANENETANFSFDSTNNDAFTTDTTSKTYLLNIINKDPDIEDLSVSNDFKVNADETLFVTFTVEGLAAPETTTSTTTVTRTITYSGYSNNGYNSNNNTTNTVSKTADEGVVAIVVSAVAAAALAAGAFTLKRKRK